MCYCVSEVYQTTISERTKYYLWLSATQNCVPFMVNHIRAHKKWLMLTASACAFLQRGVIQLQYRYRLLGKPHRHGIGRYSSVSLKDARQITSDLRNLYFSGTDRRSYFEEKTQNFLTVAKCLDYWFENYVSTTLREKTQALYGSTIMKRMHDAFPNRPASCIIVKQWVDLLTEEERDNPRRACQVLSQLRSAISWCMRCQVKDSCAIMSIQQRDFGARAACGRPRSVV